MLKDSDKWLAQTLFLLTEIQLKSAKEMNLFNMQVLLLSFILGPLVYFRCILTSEKVLRRQDMSTKQ